MPSVVRKRELILFIIIDEIDNIVICILFRRSSKYMSSWNGLQSFMVADMTRSTMIVNV